MTRANVALSNFVGGELSGLLSGRADLPVYKRSVERAENFMVLPQGAAQYRTGTRFVHQTRRNKRGQLIKFQFNDQQAYQIEVTAGYFRFYKDESIITEDPVAVSNVTHATQAVVTAASAFKNGDEVFLNGIEGMTQLNGRSYLVSDVSGLTFKITDQQGNYIDSTPMGLYVSGGTASRIYEIKTPYREQGFEEFIDEDIAQLQFTQNADVMYIDHQNYEPRKLTRSGHASWALTRYTRTADPFDAAKTVTAATQANPGVLTVATHGRSVGDSVYIDSVGGMTELNDQHYLINSVPTANTFTLKTLAGVPVNTTSFAAFTSGGKLEVIGGRNYPRAVTFTADARTMHGGTDAKPESLFASCAPTTADGVRYDNFTTGTTATDAVIFTLAPVNGQVNVVEWLSNTDKFIVAGTFGTVRRIFGATEQESITPTGINAKAVNGYGAALASPVSLGSTLFYIQRGLQGLRSLEYEYTTDGYLTTDRNLVSDHLPYPGLAQGAFQQGKPDILWCTRLDGVLLGLTYKDKEDISGWARHTLGGAHVTGAGVRRRFGKVLWASSMSRPTGSEQLWLIVERVVNGVTLRSVEFVTDPPVYPAFLDFYQGEDGDREEDERHFYNRLYEVQKQAVHLDCSLTYDGRDLGRDSNAQLTISGASVVSTANIFTASMIGRQIWGAYDENGEGGGRAVITAVGGTSASLNILKPFEKTVYRPGEWYLTTNALTGLEHLEGETVGVILDGGPGNNGVVQAGALSLPQQVSVVTIGLKYRGVLKSLNLDVGGVSGSAQSKPRNVVESKIRFLNSSAARFGTNPYDLQRVEFRQAGGITDRPISLYSGFQSITYFDDWEEDKSVYVIQETPAPCTVTVLDIYTDTSDE